MYLISNATTNVFHSCKVKFKRLHSLRTFNLCQTQEIKTNPPIPKMNKNANIFIGFHKSRFEKECISPRINIIKKNNGIKYFPHLYRDPKTIL